MLPFTSGRLVIGSLLFIYSNAFVDYGLPSYFKSINIFSIQTGVIFVAFAEKFVWMSLWLSEWSKPFE